MKLVVQQAAPRIPEGAKFGGEVIISCSDCRAGLLSIIVTRSDLIDSNTGKPFEWNLQANCPFCGDKSFVTVVRGGFHAGGYGLPKPGDPEETIPSTIWTGSYESRPNNVLFLNVMKASEDAKPVKIQS